MSRIYDNKPLENLPLINIDVGGVWDTRKYASGNGILLEGLVKKKCHFQVSDSSKKKYQFYTFFIQVSRAHRRKFDPKGGEIEPNFSETQKVLTGYLNSSYKVEPKGETDRLTEGQVKDILNQQELARHTDRHGSPGTVALWLDTDQVQGVEIDCGDKVRVKTQGDGPFVFSISKLDSETVTVSNYAGGEAVGTSWTDKIMAMKSDRPAENAGVDDDEWDD